MVHPVIPRILSLANNTEVDQQYHRTLAGHNSTLAGIVNLVSGRWYTQVAKYSTDPNGGMTGMSVGSSFQQYTLPGSSSECDSSYRDPTNDVIESMNKLMAYSGAHAALQDPSSPDSVVSIDGHPTGTEPVFSSHYWYCKYNSPIRKNEAFADHLLPSSSRRRSDCRNCLHSSRCPHILGLVRISRTGNSHTPSNIECI